MIYEAILHTGNRTGTDKEFGQDIDGIMAIIGDGFDSDGYCIISPISNEDTEKFINAIYDADDDKYYSREEFTENYKENGLDGFIFVGTDEVEIIKQFKGDL